MPRAAVVLPSTTYRAGDFVSAAESLGIDLVVASEQPPPFDMGDRYLQIDCSDLEEAASAIAALGDEVPLDGVVAADDSGVVIAALVGTDLGLPANSPGSAMATRDKLQMRRLLSKGEVPQPLFRDIPADLSPAEATAEMAFPLVIKPLDRSASQGVIRVDTARALTETVDRIRKIVGDPSATLLAEQYLPGVEVAIEGIVRDGDLTVLATFDKPDTRPGPVFPETIFVTPSRMSGDEAAECERVSAMALRTLGLAHGPVHIELRVEGGQPKVIEVAARSIGGLCSRSLDFGLMGTSLEALILRNAVGLDKPELRRGPHASGVLMIPIPASGQLVAVEGIDETRSIPGVTGVDITARPGDEVLAPPDGDRYLGFVFAKATTADDVEHSLRAAMETVVVRVEAGGSTST